MGVRDRMPKRYRFFCTSVDFAFAGAEKLPRPTVAYVVLVLKNGKAVIHTGAMVSPTDENQFMQYTYQWLVPVDPDEVDHLEIGTTKIAIL